jgi:PLD-like domain
MNIFGTDLYRNKLAAALANSQQEIAIISAYITIEGIEWILNKVPDNVKCRVLSRWACSDLLSGASDLEVYKKLKERDYSLFILSDLHAKVAVVDKRGLFLGSANATNSGLKLVPGGNREIGTFIIPDEEDLNLIEALFNEGIFITEELYKRFEEEITLLKAEIGKVPTRRNWSKDLLNELRKTPQRIWVTETLWCQSPEELIGNNVKLDSSEVQHDLALLGLEVFEQTQLSLEELEKAFLNSRIFNWLVGRLNSKENKEIYFGELTQALHNSFLDDPAPYRRTVKDLLSNLLEWITSLSGNLIIIDRPNHSQRIRIVE